VAEASTLTQAGAVLGRQRQPAPRAAWLERAATSTVQACARGARSLRDAEAAGQAGVTWPWSTGPVEGQSNRLTRRNRQMGGRAHMDLLRRRVLSETSVQRRRANPSGIDGAVTGGGMVCRRTNMVVSESYLSYRPTSPGGQNKKDSMILVFFSGVCCSLR
jgi:hypothetical protein